MSTRNKEINKMIKHKSAIINQLFYAEVNALVKKFNKINEYEVNEIEEIFEQVKHEDTKSYLINNTNKLSEVIKENRNRNLKQGEIELFSWINEEIEEIRIHKASEYYEELEIVDYIEIGEYLIQKEGCNLKEYANEVLEERLKDEFWVDTLFTKDDVVEMWVNETTKEEAIEQILESNDIEEVLGLEPQYAFSINDTDYKYSYIEE